MKLKVITHFEKEDINFQGDYWDIEVFVDDKPAVIFGDHYHDKGKDKCTGFIQACLYFFPDVEIEKLNVADRT